MSKKQRHQIALASAIFLGGIHLVWAGLILVGVAQKIMEFVFWAHMIQVPFMIGPFNPMAAITLVVMTGVLGYALGYFGAIIWHKTHR